MIESTKPQREHANDYIMKRGRLYRLTAQE